VEFRHLPNPMLEVTRIRRTVCTDAIVEGLGGLFTKGKGSARASEFVAIVSRGSWPFASRENDRHHPVTALVEDTVRAESPKRSSSSPRHDGSAEVILS
jgi:hypothetical protein